MKSYSVDFDKEKHAYARVEGTNVSYKDLAQVCGRIVGKDAQWAVIFLERAALGEIPILYKRHNKRLGHRKELGGQKGRYPKKAAAAVLKVLKSAVANGLARSLGMSYRIVHAAANKKHTYPRSASKGRTARSNLELARIEMVLAGMDTVPNGVELKTPGNQAKEISKSGGQKSASETTTQSKKETSQKETLKDKKEERIFDSGKSAKMEKSKEEKKIHDNRDKKSEVKS